MVIWDTARIHSSATTYFGGYAPRNDLMMLALRPLLLVATLGALSACDVGPVTTPPDPPAPAQTRVVRLTLSPDTVAAGDTALVHVVIEDSLDARFRYNWGMPRESMIPVSGRLDGPQVRFVAPRTSEDSGRVVSAGTSVYITSGVPGTRGVTYSFDIPILN